jgi:hypothetical protein
LTTDKAEIKRTSGTASVEIKNRSFAVVAEKARGNKATLKHLQKYGTNGNRNHFQKQILPVRTLINWAICQFYLQLWKY